MNQDIFSAFRPAIVLTILFAVLLGLLYPLAITGIGQAIFPRQANGSVVSVDGRVAGSALIGQTFDSPRYFRSRPSAAGQGHDGLASSGSNLGPTSEVLADRVRTDVASLAVEATGRPVPADLVTASGSGLDPDISPAAAMFQVTRVARTRGLDEAVVRALVRRSIRQPVPAFLGDPHVNLLGLNRALDALDRRR